MWILAAVALVYIEQGRALSPTWSAILAVIGLTVSMPWRQA